MVGDGCQREDVRGRREGGGREKDGVDCICGEMARIQRSTARWVVRREPASKSPSSYVLADSYVLCCCRGAAQEKALRPGALCSQTMYEWWLRSYEPDSASRRASLAKFTAPVMEIQVHPSKL